MKNPLEEIRKKRNIKYNLRGELDEQKTLENHVGLGPNRYRPDGDWKYDLENRKKICLPPVFLFLNFENNKTI